MTLDEIIEYENESTWLEFKGKEYHKDNNVELLKDVMSMANAQIDNTKYIIVGVKDSPGVGRKFWGIDNVTDQANLENLIQENIEPLIQFKYYVHEFRGKKLGILEIYGNSNWPYMMRKQNSSLEKGEIWIRKGTRKSRANREDLDRMIWYRAQKILSEEIKLGFNKSLDNEITILIPEIDESRIPSNIARAKYEKNLLELKDYIKQENSVAKTLLYYSGERGLYPKYKSETKEINLGSTEFGPPTYMNEEKLISKIENVKKTHEQEDYYFFLGENSTIINFWMCNGGNQFLEDVLVSFKFRKDVFWIATEIPEKPKSKKDYILMSVHEKTHNPTSGYPEVSCNDMHYIVQEKYKDIRHKEYTKLFDEDLRVSINKKWVNGYYEIPYKISARNLSQPVEGSLKVFLTTEEKS